MIIFLDRERYPKNSNRFADITFYLHDKFSSSGSLAANVKKNINKLKAQAQAMMSTEEITMDEVNEEDEMSDDDDDENEDYPIQKTGWKCLSSFSTDYVNEHIASLSMYSPMS